MMKYIIYLFGLTLLLSCEPKVLFQKALPPDGKVLTSIPETFRGVYFSECDTTILHATENVIYTEGYFQFKTTLARIKEEPGCSISDKGMYLRGTKECVPFEYVNEDTVLVKLVQKDTMFFISDEQVAKLYKGNLYLNHKEKNGSWLSSIVEPDEQGHLHWSIIDVPNKEEKVKEITTDYKSYTRDDDEEIFVMNPTQLEFEQLLNKDYLKECDVYIPLNFQILY